MRNDAALSTPFLNLERFVSGGCEEGLLGLAFHPDYNRAGDADNGRFFVFYREGSGNDPHNNGQNHDPAWRPAHLALRTS